MEVDTNGQVRKFTFLQKEKVRKFTWKIENFSSIKDKKLYSETFYVGGYPWRLLVFPKGIDVNHISICVDVADSETLPVGWSRYAELRLTLVNQLDLKTSTTKVTKHEFNANAVNWGFSSFLPLSQLHDPKSGYVVNDACLVEADISTDRTIYLESHKLKAKLKKRRAVIIATAPAVLSSPGQDKTKSTNQNLPTTTQSSSPTSSDTIEPEDPMEEDMDTFFTSLERELSSSNIVYSQEQAKEALAKIEEALNMSPAHFYDSGNSFSLKEAFKILSSVDCFSTITVGQKTELLSMEESLKELPDRAAKAVQDRNLLSEKESLKLTLTRNLEHSLVKFKEAKAEKEKLEQKIADILNEKKKIFRICKELKMEVEAIGKELPEYEAKAKVAEEEEKTVETEWARMKDLISSIKEKI